MYKSQWKKLETPFKSFMEKEDNEFIGQPTNEQVIKRIKDQESNFIALFVLGCVVTFTIMFVIQKLI